MKRFNALPGDEIYVFSKPRGSKEPIKIKCKVTEISETKLHAEGYEYNYWLHQSAYKKRWILMEDEVEIAD